MTYEEIKEILREMDCGIMNRFKYPQDASPETINDILSDITGKDNIQITEDMNGHDMDWGIDFEFEGHAYHAWGSVYSGSFLIQKEE